MISPEYNAIGLIYGAAGSAAIPAVHQGLKILYNYETRGECYLKTFNKNFQEYCTDDWSYIYLKEVPDIIVGQPDCKIYSNLRTRKREVVDFKDTMLYDYLYKVQILGPLIFVVENLSKGIEAMRYYLSNDAKMDFDFHVHPLEGSFIESEMLYNKYRIYYIDINAKYFLPQTRNRTFAVGINKDYSSKEFKYVHPKNEYFFNVKKVLKDLEKEESFKLFHNHRNPNHSEERIKRFNKLKPGESYYGTQNNRRLDPEGFCNAITSHCTQYVHYKLPRTLTCRENARLQGFPDDFIFYGNNTECLDMVGKAISPPVFGYLLKQILEYMEGL